MARHACRPVDAESRKIVRATALCEEAEEIAQLFVELMNARAIVDLVRDAVHIHPTLAEAAKNATLASCRA